jgi:hypothetical protein
VTIGPEGRTAAPTGEDADPQECLWHFKWSRTTHVGDRRAALRADGCGTGH